MALKQAWVSGPSTLRGGISSDHSPEEPPSLTPPALASCHCARGVAGGCSANPSAVLSQLALAAVALLFPTKLAVPVIGKERPFHKASYCNTMRTTGKLAGPSNLYRPEKAMVRACHVNEELYLHQPQHSLQFHSAGLLLLPLLLQ